MNPTPALSTSFLTSRCLVRRVDAGDAPFLFEATQVEGFNRWLSWDAPGDVSVIRRRFHRCRRQWRDREAFCFSVLPLGAANVIGGVDLKPDLFDPKPAEYALGYWTHPRYQGRGYAREFVAGLLDWAFGELDARRLIAGVGLDNAPSHRLLHRLGFSVFDRRSTCSASKSFDNIRYELRTPRALKMAAD